MFELTWTKAIIAAVVALPTVAAIVWRFLVRKDKKEAKDAVDNANQAAADLDPDAIGGGLRRGVHRK
ncbi:MAG TPA: hypothetical protein VMY35_09710 [Phycisphaerae bacterium]|nr:hypothetical protein [Phycisphaerae bacterium]HUX01238.1 hypothetical protein [Phycisphaerae bacterium]